MSSSTNHWYVAVTYRKERLIKRELDKIKVENFIPFRKVVKERKGKKVKAWNWSFPDTFSFIQIQKPAWNLPASRG
ncbi:MAG: transcription termination/antitermination NusG family protein [Bacteroidales bacterium]